MYRELSVTLLFVFATGSSFAFAGGYDDFSRGIDANNRGNSESAISAFTSAIISNDLASAYLPVAYLGRARADMTAAQCAPAVADLTEAIRLKPDYLDAYVLRSDANVCLNRPVAALKDISTAINIKSAAPLYFNRAREQWSMGHFREAAEDLTKATQKDPKDPYIVLWEDIVGTRLGMFGRSEVDRHVAALGNSSWPAPLLALYSGAADPANVYQAIADVAGARTVYNQKCEADFYVGEWQLGRGNASTAKALLKTAEEECPHDFIAYVAAREELRRSQ